ncbi:serine hydrolase domain-containing protein [Paenibacillus protaetiae]|uniref:Class A beta-lactamase-related serine hydrolase n=1 Tax=Paenibacillus protaetiae TaxID=2509456 RepID=A0A4P6ER74_9BACL|nr:serine hydrolase domain-containing protein [Paenibacillus protaetiae]QAY65364.1 class A beta-lactamase-related serine hydrolase [Paenibacillus protaetiae]
MLDQFAVKQLKNTLRNGIESNEIAGANLLVLKEGSELFYHEDGLADRETEKSITRDSIFRLYSMTKPVTAASVMILLERGMIDLFDPVSRYLPGFKNQTAEVNGELVPVHREVTIHDLLSMTSGLLYGGTNRTGRATEALFEEVDRRLTGDSPMTTQEIANRLGQGPLAFQPGSYWAYGTSADVLGAVVEVASGMRFGEFLKQEIFEPLDMHDTGFWVEPSKRERLVNTYQNNSEGGLALFAGSHLGINHRMDRQPAYEAGGAGLVSTIDDYAQFASMLLNEGTYKGVQILRPTTVRYLTSAVLNEKQQKGFENWHMLTGHSYGNQMRVMTDSRRAGIIGTTGEYGWDGWLGAYFSNSPQDKLTVLFLTQKKDAGTLPVTRKLRNIVYSCL